jgi:hypothetical protein
MEICNDCKTRKALPHRILCGCCKTRRYRAKNPIHAAYQNLRHNAKRRGHAFALSFADFQRFCIATDYIVRKGKTVESYSIDRIDNNKGYELDNIQVLTLSENSQKATKKVVFEPTNRELYTTTHYPLSIIHYPLSESCPF